MSFDVVAFTESLARSRNLDQKSKRDLIKAVRKGLGLSPGLDIKPGDVYKSSRGLRMVVKGRCDGTYSLISLKAFDNQYAKLVGQTVSGIDQSRESLEEYMASRQYIKVGRVEDLNIGAITGAG